jgi:transcriptional regulator
MKTRKNVSELEKRQAAEDEKIRNQIDVSSGMPREDSV